MKGLDHVDKQPRVMLEKYPTADIGLQLASVSTANVTANDL
jgi:hypothetical protein